MFGAVGQHHFALVHLDHFLSDGQPEAQADCFFVSIKRLRRLLERFRRKPGAIVLDFDVEPEGLLVLRLDLEANGYLLIFSIFLQRIEEYLGEAEGEGLGVSGDGNGAVYCLQGRLVGSSRVIFVSLGVRLLVRLCRFQKPQS